MASVLLDLRLALFICRTVIHDLIQKSELSERFRESVRTYYGLINLGDLCWLLVLFLKGNWVLGGHLPVLAMASGAVVRSAQYSTTARTKEKRCYKDDRPWSETIEEIRLNTVQEDEGKDENKHRRSSLHSQTS